ncbi:MAG: Mrp/NBP35 family ATP-binding protein [Armatimonadetes bacterium]|nr:Mrp/NBP35 family ATP-binding protein [Armatimonadota bacterium]
MAISENDVLSALAQVVDPDLRKDIVSLGFVKDLVISDKGDVSLKIELTTPACPVKDQMHEQAIELVEALPGVGGVNIEMTARVRERSSEPQDLIPGVRHAIAIASGKGGVGKSTVTVNLAIALAQTGAKVGLLDADVYGPSIPLMMGCANERPYTQDQKILPIEKYGLKMMSLGFLIEPDQAVMWRGPMVAGTVKQLLQDVQWGELDYLLIDLPPGTGDAPMSLAQLAPLTGVVIVATPQHVAANIAGKAVLMFRKLDTHILGVVENMAGYICTNCGATNEIFTGLGGEELSKRLNVPFLGSIPLDPVISSSGDNGEPALIANPDRPQADSFKLIAGKLAQQASIMNYARKDLTRI